MNEKNLQEVKIDQSEHLTDVFPWRERRYGCMRLCDIYECAKDLFPDYQDEYYALARRAATCGVHLEFNEVGYGTADYKKSLRWANFCHLRLCPLCIARRSRRAAVKLSQVMSAVKQADSDIQYIFLTLTVENCRYEDLGKTLDTLTKAWFKLIRHRAFERAIKGWFRALEITRNPVRQDFHPHIHAILAVPSAYFDPASGLYINQKAFEWTRHWQVALGVSPSDDTIVHVEGTYSKRKGRGKPRTDDEASEDAVQEAAKYPTKETDYIDQDLGIEEAAYIVHWYTQGMRRKRLTAFGGVMKAVAKQFDADNLDDGDLIHTDVDQIRDDIAETIATYGWSLGVGDYILARRERNPIHGRVFVAADEDGEDGEWVSPYELGVDE